MISPCDISVVMRSYNSLYVQMHSIVCAQRCVIKLLFSRHFCCDCLCPTFRSIRKNYVHLKRGGGRELMSSTIIVYFWYYKDFFTIGVWSCEHSIFEISPRNVYFEQSGNFSSSKIKRYAVSIFNVVS